MSDTEKIIEISLAKIESSRLKKKGTGKLHKNLLVNSLLNRVRETESGKTCIEPLMNYRESKLIIDLDNDDYDMDKVPSPVKERTVSQQRITQSPLSRKQESIVSKLNTRSIGKADNILKTIPIYDESIEMKENIQNKKTICDCVKTTFECPTCEVPKRTKKRLHSIEILDADCPRKRLRCLWTPNIDQKSQDSFSVTSLSSLFGNLVANSDSDKSLDLRNKFVSAMVAC